VFGFFWQFRWEFLTFFEKIKLATLVGSYHYSSILVGTRWIRVYGPYLISFTINMPQNFYRLLDVCVNLI